MIAFSSFVFHGVFDEFPTLRFAFLEGGSGWVGLWCDRMDRTYQYHVDLAPDGKPVVLKEKLPSDYFRNGRVFIGCEGSEQSLPAQIKRVGNELFMFASGFSALKSRRKIACTGLTRFWSRRNSARQTRRRFWRHDRGALSADIAAVAVA